MILSSGKMPYEICDLLQVNSVHGSGVQQDLTIVEIDDGYKQVPYTYFCILCMFKIFYKETLKNAHLHNKHDHFLF